MNRLLKSFSVFYLLGFLIQFIEYGVPDGTVREGFNVVVFPAILSGGVLFGFYLDERTVIGRMNRWTKVFVSSYLMIFAIRVSRTGVPDGTFGEIFDVVIEPAILSGCILLGFYLNERGTSIRGALRWVIRGVSGRGSNTDTTPDEQ